MRNPELETKFTPEEQQRAQQLLDQLLNNIFDNEALILLLLMHHGVGKKRSLANAGLNKICVALGVDPQRLKQARRNMVTYELLEKSLTHYSLTAAGFLVGSSFRDGSACSSDASRRAFTQSDQLPPKEPTDPRFKIKSLTDVLVGTVKLGQRYKTPNTRTRIAGGATVEEIRQMALKEETTFEEAMATIDKAVEIGAGFWSGGRFFMLSVAGINDGKKQIPMPPRVVNHPE